MNKIVSHQEALYRKSESMPGVYDPVYEVITNESYVDNNRVLKRSSVVEKDNSVEMSKYHAEDFYLENLVALGALQRDKRYTLNPSAMDMMDAVENGFEILDDMVQMSSDIENNDNK